MLDWSGCECCILASGPSLTTRQVDLVRGWRGIKHQVIAINTTFLLAPWADVIYACDEPWWKEYYGEVWNACPGSSLWTQSLGHSKRAGVSVVQSKYAEGLSREPGTIYMERPSSGGHQAVSLAVQFGAKRIILLGYDMHAIGGKKHHHPDHPSPMNTSLPFKDWISSFGKMAAGLSAAGVDVVNATPNSSLRCFPLVDLADALA